jgi:hypothetical protein
MGVTRPLFQCFAMDIEQETEYIDLVSAKTVT